MGLPGLGLELATPAALWGFAAAAPIAFFHFYFRRRRRVLVPFAPLLVESRGPVRREARFRRLQDGLTLLARLLALGCAVLALAGLRPAAAPTPAPALYLVVDADVSTAVREADDALRLAHGLALAQDWVRAQPAIGSEDVRLAAPVSVVLAERVPRLLVAPTRRRAGALERLGRLPEPAPCRTDLGAAVGLALDGARRQPAAHLVVITSRAFDLEEPLPASVTTTVQGMGAACDDQGFVDAAVQPLPDANGYAVRLRVRNQDRHARTRALTVRVADEVVAKEDALEIAAGAERTVTFEVPAPRAGTWLTCVLEGEDVFPANDAFDAWLAPRPRPSVLVAHGGAVRPYTAAGLEALARSGILDEARSGYVQASALAQAEPRDVVIVDGVPLEPAALRPGAYLFLAPLAGALPFDVGPVIDEPLVWRTQPNHPLVRDLDFRRAYVLRARPLTGDGLEPLAYAGGHAVIGEGERDGVRYVVLGLDPEGSALPHQAALPMLLKKAILRLARAPRSPLRGFYRCGDILRPATALPGGADALVSWSGHSRDEVLSTLWSGQSRARLDPQGAAWRVPAGAVGRVEIRTRGAATSAGSGAAAWLGHTAFFDPDVGADVVPLRSQGEAPARAAQPTTPGRRWRSGLLVLAGLLLLLDLTLLARSMRRRE